MTTETMEPAVGDRIQLLGLDDKPLKDIYEILNAINKSSFKVRDLKGVTINVHKSRIARIVEKPEQAEAEEEKETSMSETSEGTAVAEKVEKPVEKAVEKTVKPKAEKPAKVAVAAVKKEKEPKEPKVLPFDLKTWVKEHGGVHLFKSVKFDHSTHKLTSHVAVDEKGGYYYCLNTYTYPDGIMSLGKKGAGGNKYPLKGHRLTMTKQTKKGEEKVTNNGILTAEQVIARYEKKGYKKG